MYEYNIRGIYGMDGNMGNIWYGMDGNIWTRLIWYYGYMIDIGGHGSIIFLGV